MEAFHLAKGSPHLVVIQALHEFLDVGWIDFTRCNIDVHGLSPMCGFSRQAEGFFDPGIPATG